MVAGDGWEGEVWFLVVVFFLFVSFLPANKKAAGSRSIETLPQAFLPRLHSNEAEGESESVGVSYAGTSMLLPWRGFASAPIAPMSISISCWNNFELVVCCSLCPFLSLAMMAGKGNLGGTQLLSLVECCPSYVRLRHRGGGRAEGRWDLVLHGKTRLLQLAEFINGGDAAPLLSLVDEAAPCCGVVCAAGSSTSWPASQIGGPYASTLRRSSPSRCQVVSSPTTALAAVAWSSSSIPVERTRDSIAFSAFLLGSFMLLVRNVL